MLLCVKIKLNDASLCKKIKLNDASLCKNAADE